MLGAVVLPLTTPLAFTTTALAAFSVVGFEGASFRAATGAFGGAASLSLTTTFDGAFSLATSVSLVTFGPVDASFGAFAATTGSLTFTDLLLETLASSAGSADDGDFTLAAIFVGSRAELLFDGSVGASASLFVAALSTLTVFMISLARTDTDDADAVVGWRNRCDVSGFSTTKRLALHVLHPPRALSSTHTPKTKRGTWTRAI